MGEGRRGEAICPYCRDAIDEGERTVACPGCGVRLHRGCGRELERCPTPGCERRLPAGVTLEESSEEAPGAVPQLSGEALAELRSFLAEDAEERPGRAVRPVSREQEAAGLEAFKTVTLLFVVIGALWGMTDYAITAKTLRPGVAFGWAFGGGLIGVAPGLLFGLLAAAAGERSEEVPGAAALNFLLIILGLIVGGGVGFWLLASLLGAVRAQVLGALVGATAAGIAGRSLLGWRGFVEALRAMDRNNH